MLLQSEAPTGLLWEAAKAYIKGFIIQYATFEKTERAARESCLQLEAQITEANFKFDMSEGNLRNFVSLQIRAAMMKSSDQISPILASQM